MLKFEFGTPCCAATEIVPYQQLGSWLKAYPCVKDLFHTRINQSSKNITWSVVSFTSKTSMVHTNWVHWWDCGGLSLTGPQVCGGHFRVPKERGHPENMDHSWHSKKAKGLATGSTSQSSCIDSRGLRIAGRLNTTLYWMTWRYAFGDMLFPAECSAIVISISRPKAHLK